MADRRYEYKTISVSRIAAEDIGDKLNDYAADGWRVKAPIDSIKTSKVFVLERPVE